MSGKFMKVKRIVIPTITMLIIASQLLGCAAASSKEMLDMLNRQEAIVIEVAEPISQEQGTEIQLDWTELASVTTYREFRDTFDDTLGITAHGETGKNGIVYVDLEGNHTNNSTLYYAFMNQKFRDNAWNNTDATKAIINAAQSIYADVESEQASLLAGYNAYFNLLADAEPNYANMNSTLTRLEAMSLLFKADTPVYDIEPNQTFLNAVENDDLALYAQEVNQHSYLKAENLSLDGNTANGTITRAEYIYMIVQRYFADDYNNTTGKESCFSDAKNGGDIATKVGIKTKDKETGEVIAPNRWQSYELSYSLQNESNGLTNDLYRALVVAQQKGLITGSECRWSDGLTKAEALNFLVRAYEALPAVTNADRGTSVADPITQSMQQSTINANEVDSKLNESTGVEIVEVLDTKMWVIKSGNLRTGDGTNYNLVDVLVVNAELSITGKTSNGWYEVAWGDGKAYAPAECLSTEKPAGLTKQEEGGSSLTDEEWAEYDAKFEELLNQSTETEGDTLPDGRPIAENIDRDTDQAPDGSW